MLNFWTIENSKLVRFVNKYRNIKASLQLSKNSIQICFLITVWNKVSNWKRSQEHSMMVSNSRLFKLYLKNIIKLKLIFSQIIFESTVSNPSIIKKSNLAGGCALMKIVRIQLDILRRGFNKWWIRWDRMQVQKGY
jgi:hypothetical protein